MAEPIGIAASVSHLQRYSVRPSTAFHTSRRRKTAPPTPKRCWWSLTARKPGCWSGRILWASCARTISGAIHSWPIQIWKYLFDVALTRLSAFWRMPGNSRLNMGAAQRLNRNTSNMLRWWASIAWAFSKLKNSDSSLGLVDWVNRQIGCPESNGQSGMEPNFEYFFHTLKNLWTA